MSPITPMKCAVMVISQMAVMYSLVLLSAGNAWSITGHVLCLWLHAYELLVSHSATSGGESRSSTCISLRCIWSVGHHCSMCLLPSLYMEHMEHNSQK